MIFITLGTQKIQFDRVLKELDKLVEEGKLSSKDLLVQCVYSKYNPKNYEIFGLKPQKEIDEITEKADIIITHSGTGSIINSLKKGKRIIIIPRLKKYKEHVDNHQTELAKFFNVKYNIPVVLEMEKLYETIEQIDKYDPVKWEVDNKRLISSIENTINQLL